MRIRLRIIIDLDLSGITQRLKECGTLMLTDCLRLTYDIRKLHDDNPKFCDWKPHGEDKL